MAGQSGPSPRVPTARPANTTDPRRDKINMAGLALKPISGGKGRTPLDDIDQTVKDTIEEAVTYFVTEGNEGRLETEPFTSRDVAEDWLSDARAYAYQRPNRRVVVSGNAAKVPGAAKDGPHVVRFSVTTYVAPAAEDGAAPAEG